MNRRTIIGTSVASLLVPAVATAQSTPSPDREDRELVSRAVVDSLSRTPPVITLSALEQSEVTQQLLIEAAGGVTPVVERWNDWNDDDLRDVLGAIIIGPDVGLGAVSVYDTPDIAWANLQEQRSRSSLSGYFDVAGMRADRVEVDDMTLALMRLSNVIVAASAPGDSTDIAVGIVKHIGDALWSRST